MPPEEIYLSLVKKKIVIQNKFIEYKQKIEKEYVNERVNFICVELYCEGSHFRTADKQTLRTGRAVSNL